MSTEASEEFIRALRPVVEALGASVVPERSSRPGDFAAHWDGEIVAYVRRADLHSALGRMISVVENDHGAPLSDMSRADKQASVRRLDEQGAFLLRGAVEDVANRMGVSRVTLYSYLNAIQADTAVNS